jgi:hypothetical protein
VRRNTSSRGAADGETAENEDVNPGATLTPPRPVLEAPPMTWWEHENPPQRLLPLDQLAERDGEVISLRVTPSAVQLVEGPPGARRRRRLVVNRLTNYARAGRTVLSADDERIEVRMLGERESRGVRVGDPAATPLRGRRRGGAGALATVPRGLAAASLVPAARSITTSRERNEALAELARRVVVADPAAVIAQI